MTTRYCNHFGYRANAYICAFIFFGLLSGCSSEPPHLLATPIAYEPIPAQPNLPGESPASSIKPSTEPIFNSKPTKSIPSSTYQPQQTVNLQSHHLSLSKGIAAFSQQGLQTNATGIPIGKFWRGGAAYQIPSVMIKDESSPVDLWIDVNVSPSQLAINLENYLKNNANKSLARQGLNFVVKPKNFNTSTTNIVTQAIPIAKTMSAELSGSDKDFSIQPRGPQKITTRTNMTSMWHWTVTPLRASDTGLPLTITVIADPGDGGTPLMPIQETVKVILVKTWWQKLIDVYNGIDFIYKLIMGVIGLLGVIAGIMNYICKQFKKNPRICDSIFHVKNNE